MRHRKPVRIFLGMIASVILVGCSGDGTGPASNDSDAVLGALAALGIQGTSNMQGRGITLPAPGTVNDANGVPLNALGVELTLGAIPVRPAPGSTTTPPSLIPVGVKVIAWEGGADLSAVVRALTAEALRINEDGQPVAPGQTVAVGQPDETSAAALGSYFMDDGAAIWGAKSGFFRLDVSAFDGETFDCSGTTSDGRAFTCSMTVGQMSGAFGFTAQRLLRDPADSTVTFDPTDLYEQPTTEFSLPAIRVHFVVDPN